MTDATILHPPLPDGDRLRQLLDAANAAGRRVLVTDAAGRRRPLGIDDLHHRELASEADVAVRALVEGRTALVTGAGGSIGAELCRQLAGLGVARLVMIDHAENPLFDIDRELADRSPPLARHAVVADIRSADRMGAVIARFAPHVLFHAAAHKHVPMMESNVGEAITNNVGGTRVLLDAAVDGGVRHVVLISTDKAVRPTSVMGATKRVAELLVSGAARRSGLHFVSVRFGNVLDSRGSVVPIFREQVERGGPVTVTHPEMRRYFLTIPDAVHLVLQAGALGKGGETFLLDMGEPILITDLARDMIRLGGPRDGAPIEVRYTGTRPGERLFEELIRPDERLDKTEVPLVLRVPPAASESSADAAIDALLEAAVSTPDDEAGLIARLRALVSDYRPAGRRGNDSASPPR